MLRYEVSPAVFSFTVVLAVATMLFAAAHARALQRLTDRADQLAARTAWAHAGTRR